jgi:hypothetical protein
VSQNSSHLRVALLQDWPTYPQVAAVLRHTPSEKLADYKIISRDLLNTGIGDIFPGLISLLVFLKTPNTKSVFVSMLGRKQVCRIGCEGT